AGAVEPTAVRELLIWRPSEPLEPGATYKVTGSFENPEDEYYSGYCAPEVLLLDFEFHADMGPSAPLTTPTAEVDEEMQLSAWNGLADLVCCDGAMPVEYYFDCGGGGGYVEWGDGFCASRRGFGTLHVTTSAEPDVPPSTAAMVAQQLVVDGVPGLSRLGGPLSTSDAKPM